MVIWNALFSVVFIGLLVSIGCAILFALLKNSIYAKMFVKIAAGMFALCLGCVMMERSWRSEPEQPAATMDTSSLPEPTGQDIDSYVQSLKEMISFENCTIEVDENTVYIGIWDESIVTVAQSALEGNEDAVKAWKEILSSLTEMTDGLQRGFRESGLGEYSAAVMLLTDETQEDALAIIKDGVIVYDCLTDGE
ncbi:MAG: hypothetical protein IIZ14_03475 [Solobacterium sp.]|nr:hypothetical protein [Solobacterium sp.]